MKTLHVFYGNDFAGGASYSMASIAVGLARRGHESHALIPRTRARKMHDYLQSNGVIVHEIAIPWLVYRNKDQRFSNRFKQQIKSVLNRALCPIAEQAADQIIRYNKIDIVHIGGAVISLGQKAARNNACKLVWHIREFVQEDHNLEFFPWANQYEKMRDADMLICVSDAVKKKMSTVCPNTDMVTIHNGIDTSLFFPAELSHKTRIPARLMFASGIVESKGVFVVVEAISKVSKRFPVKLDIYGNASPENLSKFADVCSENGLESIIEYKGLTQSIANEYRHHDIQIVASQCEAFGRVTAEAMFCRCLVVGADSGGTSELLGEGRGVLFKAGDSDSLAKALIKAIENDEESEVIRDRAYEYACNNLMLDDYVNRIESVYLELLDKEC